MNQGPTLSAPQNTPEARTRQVSELLNEIGGILNQRAHTLAAETSVMQKLMAVDKHAIDRLAKIETELATLQGAVRELQQIFNQRLVSVPPVL